MILKDPDREIRGRTGEQGGSESSGPGLCQPSTQQRSTLMPGQQHELTRLETRDQARRGGAFLVFNLISLLSA